MDELFFYIDEEGKDKRVDYPDFMSFVDKLLQNPQQFINCRFFLSADEAEEDFPMLLDKKSFVLNSKIFLSLKLKSFLIEHDTVLLFESISTVSSPTKNYREKFKFHLEEESEKILKILSKIGGVL